MVMAAVLTPLVIPAKTVAHDLTTIAAFLAAMLLGITLFDAVRRSA